MYAWIECILDQQQLLLELPQPREVYYQSYCGYQKDREDSALRLLRSIKGLTVREIPYPKTCCGGYCGETLLHPDHSQSLARQKISELPSWATLIVTSPDCWLLFKRYSTMQNLTIYYPIQLLDQAIIKSKKKV